jgi:microtubule-associated protein-like 6
MFGAPRQLMMENDYVQQGAYKASTPATHTGKIKYPQCKKGVWPPSDWEPRIAKRSGQLPDVRLRLDFVYGYDGMQATSPNVFYMATGDVVYFAAAVGIVYNKESHSQRFFLGHDDDILCMV